MLLMLACNDPKNGMHTGRCDSIEILASAKSPDALLELHGDSWRCVRDGSWLKIGHQRLFCAGYKEWVGNWCWDAAYVPATIDVARLLVALQRSPLWDVEAGDTLLYDAWKKRNLDVQEWQHVLEHVIDTQDEKTHHE